MPGSVLYTIVFFAWLIGAAGFVIGLHQMNSPATARAGNRLSAAGMAVAVLTTLVWLALGGLTPGGLKVEAWIIIIAGFVIGGGIGLYLARDREDDRDAPAGVAVQRGRRRRGRAGRGQ